MFTSPHCRKSFGWHTDKNINHYLIIQYMFSENSKALKKKKGRKRERKERKEENSKEGRTKG